MNSLSIAPLALGAACLLAFPYNSPAQNSSPNAPSEETTKSPPEATSSQKETIPRLIKEAQESPPIQVRKTWTHPEGQLSYTAKTGWIPIANEEGSIQARIFYTAYLAEKTTPETRPITFLFNGGPGSSSVWLHLGAVGPRILNIQGDGTQPIPPPYQLKDNPDSLLLESDLVFIDPVATGFSRPETQDSSKAFYSLHGDARSIAEFIRLFTTREQRWASQKFLYGESYGVIRAVATAHELQRKYALEVNGLILLSGLLDFSTLLPSQVNFIPDVVYLPTFTSVAHHHAKLQPDLQNDRDAALRASREFAYGEYAQALLKGSTLSSEEKQSLSEKLAELTGIKADLWYDANLRLSPGQFRQELLKDRNEIIGRFDGRTVTDSHSKFDRHAPSDPSYDRVVGAFSSAINDYLRRDLQQPSELPYEILTSKVQPWNMGAENQYASVTDELEELMRSNESLRVLVIKGLTDLATPPDAIQHSLNLLNIPEGSRSRIHDSVHSSGHMMYLNPSDLAELGKDTRTFIRESRTQPKPNSASPYPD